MPGAPFLLLPTPSYAGLRWRSKRIYQSDKLLHQEQHYVFSYEGIAYTNESGTGSMAWSDLYKAVETPKYFLLYVGKMRSLVIPKVSMTSPTDITGLRELIASQIDAKKRKLRAA